MEKPDANGYVNITWPSKNISHGGVFHTQIAQPSAAQQQFLKGRYRPLKRGEDREKMKQQLANTMAFGDSEGQKPPAPPRVIKLPPKLPTAKEKWNDLITQIRERAEWLAEMEYLGQADPHRDIVKDQIAERMRALDALGIDSECSSARSTASGFSTLRSTADVRKSARSTNESASKSVRSNPVISQSKQHYVRGSAKNRFKEENVAAFSQLSPLQYSPRRRV